MFIALTQMLFVFCVVMPVFQQAGQKPNVQNWNFFFICLSSILIAAAGYIINDYFDLNIDQVNKPDRLVVARHIKRRWTIFWHLVLSITGIGLGFYVDYTSKIWLLGLSNTACVLLLFVYSLALKRRMLIGNVAISLLTAWVILVIAWCEYNHIVKNQQSLHIDKILRITFLYAGFAFIISLIREVVKDMEDMEGDRRYNCRTMPIVWGLNATKVFIAVWLIVLITVLVIVQFYALAILGWWLSAMYGIVFIIVPLIYIFRELYRAQKSADFHRISTWIKLVMFTGIVSMVFFKFYS